MITLKIGIILFGLGFIAETMYSLPLFQVTLFTGAGFIAVSGILYGRNISKEAEKNG